MIDVPEPYELVDDPARIDPVAAHAYLSRSYWAEGISLDVVTRSIEHSLCVAIFHEGNQIAFARAVTDYATFGYLMDVHVLEEHRGKGLSHVLVRYFLEHERLQGFRRWTLFTLDAHELYRQHGFSTPAHPERLMTRDDAEVYKR